MRELIAFVQIEKGEKHSWRSAFSNKVAVKVNYSSMSVFHIFETVQMLLNRATHNIWSNQMQFTLKIVIVALEIIEI